MRDLLIWDFDGTLAYRHGMWAGALVEVLDHYGPGHQVSASDVRPYLRQGFPWHDAEKPHPELSDSDTWWKSVEPVFAFAYAGIGIDRTRALNLARQVRNHYCDPDAWFIYPDVLGTLAELSRYGWTHVVLSNHVPELEDIVTSLGLRSSFSALFNSALIGHEKPSSHAFRHVLDELGSPRRVWMIGDNPVADIAGAEAVGIPGILVRARDAGHPSSCIDLGEVSEILCDRRKPGPTECRQSELRLPVHVCSTT